ncbi:hypothetical protein I4F81_009423 [Pyropia yezoensis]|uniref:Uncharacterized protein n=1 Tax=Pyropia yezoensis TaxID=2788 RepID=A0ACC3C9D2_PYRYE|nr:hypothetical protein I4F81_009423 [Neopyropia yezoensis]
MMSSSLQGQATAAATPRDAAHCGESWTESGGFFCESPAAWALRKNIYALQAKQQTIPASDKSDDVGTWWQSNYEPNFSCAFEQRLGNAGDGGKWVCDPTSISSALAGRECVIYSVGSGRRVGFEKALHQELPDCKVFTFDHTVGDAGAQVVPSYVTFFAVRNGRRGPAGHAPAGAWEHPQGAGPRAVQPAGVARDPQGGH